MMLCQLQLIYLSLTEISSKKRRVVPLSNKCKRNKRIPRTSLSVYNQQYKCATQGNLSQPKEGKHFAIEFPRL